MTQQPDRDEHTLGHWFGPWASERVDAAGDVVEDLLDPDWLVDDDPDLGWGPPDPSLLVPEGPEKDRRSAYWEGRGWALKSGVIGLVLVLLAAGAGWPITDPSSRIGSPWLGTGTARALLTGPDGTVTRETGKLVGGSVLVSTMPATQRVSDVLGTQFTVGSFFAVESRVQRSSAGSTSQELTLMHLTTQGAVVEAITHDASWTAFQPALPKLPHDLEVGQSWETAGTATSGTSATAKGTGAPYLFQATSTDGGNGCLRLSWTLQIGTQPLQQGGETRCKTDGIVAETRTVEGRPVDWTRADTFPDGDDPRTDLTFPDQKPWSNPNTFQRLNMSTDNPEQDLFSDTVPMGQTSDRIEIFKDNYAPTLIGMRRSGGLLTNRWVAYPGRILVGAWTYGPVIVASTDNELVAYNSAGQWLWSAQQSEVVAAQPARSGDTLVVVRQDGSVSGYDLRTGVERWSRHLRADVGTDPKACGNRVFVTTLKPELVVMDVATGDTVWTKQPDHQIDSMVCRDDVIVVQTSGLDLAALNAATGDQLWAKKTGSGPHGITASQTIVMLHNDAGVSGFDLRNGERRWNLSGRASSIGTDGRVFMIAVDDGGTIIDDSATKLLRWHSASETGIGSMIVTADGAWISLPGGGQFVGTP